MKILLSEDEVRQGVARLARQIGHTYQHGPLTIVGVLTGSVVLLADLIRSLDMPLRVGVVQARSYHGRAIRPGDMILNFDLLPEVKDHHVLLVDDIFDTGNTLYELIKQLDKLQPSSIRSAVLLRKSVRERAPVATDFVGFDIPNEFVVGYGLDHNDLYRNLPYVAALEQAELEEHSA